MKISIKSEVLSIFVIALAIAASFYFYSVFPERVPTHWNFAGDVDGWGSRATGAFAIPAMLVGMYLLFLVLPKFDPKKERYEQFEKPYNVVRTLILLFLAVIYFLASFNALGYNIAIEKWVPVLVGLLFVLLGNYLSKVKMNWFLGIRTPWTMSSETVWNKTHRFGSKAFVLSGLLIIITAFAPAFYKTISFILAMIVIIFGTIGYSYWVYRQESKNLKNQENKN
ncbi:MAG: SdpI family protein [Patescibacteria group bacterium]|nr:SdpI family protein [Patescibacteria group bacterium]MDD4611038.1 SdpI family protein [Patescibacteria group bacterium]